MKILFSIDSFSAGGKERRLMELMKGLKLNGENDFQLIILSNDIHFKEIHDLDITIHHLIRTTKKDVTIFKKIYTICQSYKPDLAHCWDSMSAVYVLPALKLLQIKFVNGMVTDAPANAGSLNKYWLRARLTFPFSDLIIGNSNAGLKAYNAPRSKSICIYNGFNFDRLKSVISTSEMRAQLGIRSKYVVGMVATFSEYKDYATYFSACQMILKKRDDVTFLAIGNRTDSWESTQLIDTQYIDYFRLLGSRSDVESLINCMDVGVLATFTEGVSNAILEYMALGKPVIATAGGGTVEIIENNKTGFLVNAMDPISLSEKIELLLTNEGLRLRMGEAGKQRVHTHFSIRKMVDEFLLNYQRTIAQ
ncbi:glycosyltransferase [Chryseolinea sp. H1M3-3]|uniref:glycosyltransferase n=1 Tax=Chryseolinea sp. H1M3-3 TaxID=3034144 RepID=UPI0023EC10B6|nr:glycosyltransferase [Chryseolinea sp. H1M3-3]